MRRARSSERASLGVALLAIRPREPRRLGVPAAGPAPTLILLLLTTAITLNLLRLYELPAVGGAKMVSGSFGVRCALQPSSPRAPARSSAQRSAPRAAGQSAASVFGALGLGLALPFLAVAFIPALHQLPKPGAWMVRVQRFLAIPMAATALARLWLLRGRLGGAK